MNKDILETKVAFEHIAKNNEEMIIEYYRVGSEKHAQTVTENICDTRFYSLVEQSMENWKA